MAGFRRFSQPMDQEEGNRRMIRRMFMIVLCLTLSASCEGWLDEYFNVSDNEIVKNEAIKWITLCTEKATKWEEGVRVRKMDETLCAENKKINTCEKSNSSERVVEEYLKKLIQDSKNLCHDSFNDAVNLRVNRLIENSTNICSGILNEEKHITCSIVIILSFIFSGICIMCDIFRIKKKLLTRKNLWTPKKCHQVSEVNVEEGVDIIEYPLV